MVPMWSRARRFANVYAFASLDMLGVVLWLSAWASTASYVAQGKSEGSEDGENSGESGCDNFSYGSPGRCHLVTGTTVLGAFIMLGFVATSWFSFRAVMEYKRTGLIPNQGLSGAGGAQRKHDFQAETQGDFDSNVHNDDFDDGTEDRPAHGYRGQSRYDRQYAPLHQRDQTELRPQEPLSPLDPISTTPYPVQPSYGTSQGHQEPTGYGGAGSYR
jgi:translocation protein SEC72